MSFLNIMKGLVHQGRWVPPRRDDWEVLTLLGLTTQDVREVLLTLQVSHYCKGPLPDDDPSRPGEVWVFQCRLQGSVIELYVKLKVPPDERYLVVLSFHPPEHPIVQPYRND